MRLRARMTPRVEMMESRALLSGVSPTLPTVAPLVSPPTTTPIDLDGTFRGTYAHHANKANTGTAFDLFGSGHVSNVGHASVSGTLRDPGATGTSHSGGVVYLAGDKGTLTLKLVGPSQTSNGLADHFAFTVEGGTGKYAHDTGSGTASLVLIPGGAKGGPKHNEFTLVLTSIKS